MSDTATKLEYLNGTKQALKDSINALGGDITSETTFRNYATELDTIYDNLPKTTGEGSNLSLTTLKGRINVDDILGNTKQDTTNGYQLLDSTLAKLKTLNTRGTWSNNVYTINGATITINDDMSIKVNGTTTAQVTLMLNGGTMTYPTGTYYLSGASNGSNDTYDVRIFNYDGTSAVAQCFTGTKQVAVVNNSQGFNMAVVVRSGVTCNNTMFYPMLSTTNTSNYEPYTNGASPNPTYPQDINVVTGTQEAVVQNKNLAYIEAEGKYRSSASGNFSINANYNGYIAKVKPSTTYSGSFTNMASNYNDVSNLCYFDKNMNFISGNSYNTANKTFTTPSNCAYATMAVKTTITDFQVELGSTASSYVEHQEQTKTLHLSSKNLLDTKPVTDSTQKKGIITTYDSETGKISFSGTTTGSYPWLSDINISTPIPIGTNLVLSTKVAKNYQIIVRLYDDNNTNEAISISANATSGTKTTTKTITRLAILLNIDSGVTINDELYLQLELGSTPTTYTPYYNYELCKIGTYQDRIFRTSGKNLLDISKFEEHYTIDSNGLPAYNGGQTRITNTTPINVEGIDKVTLTCTLNGKSFIYSLLKADNTLISRVAGNPSGTTITIGEAKYLYICFYDNATLSNITDAMLNEGSIALPYEPYGSDKWYIEKNIKKRIYASNEIVQVNGLSYTNLTYFSIPKSNDSIDYNNFATSSALFDKYLIQNVVNWDSTNNIDRISNRANAQTYWIGVPLGTNIETYRTQVGEIINYYILATPTYTEITNETLQNELNELEKMMSYSGQTNISISGNLPMILDVSALKGESE